MRASRLLSTLIMLQLRGPLTADELAREFEVSVRTIYRDIDALSAAGVPVYGDRGPGGGFQLHDGYRTRLTGLNPDEAEAMLLIGIPGTAAAMGLGTAAARARDKLLAALPGTNADGAGRIAGRFHLDTADWYRTARPTPFLTQVARAVLDQNRLSMTYESWTATRDWQIDPYGLVLKTGSWYLVARGHGKIRSFNVADIKSLAVSSDKVEIPIQFELANWWLETTRDFERRLRPGTAVLRATKLGLQRLRLLGSFASDAVAGAVGPDPTGGFLLHLPLESIESAAPMLLGIGPEIDVITPPELRTEIARLAKQVIDRMNG